MSNLRAWLAEKSPEEVEHFLREISRLCLEGNQIRKLYRLLSNYDFIEAKINHPQFGLQLLIEDYELIENAELSNHREYDSETLKDLKLIKEALQLSAHILNQDTKQLPGQLTGRLLPFKKQTKIQRLLQQISQTEITWLRPLAPSLMPPGTKLIRTLSNHRDGITAIKITPDGQRVISGSYDKSLKVWDLSTGQELFTFEGHSGSIEALAVTSDCKRLVSGSSLVFGSADNTLKVWDLTNGRQKFNLQGHSRSILEVFITPDDRRVISASIDNIKVWDLTTGQELFTIKCHNKERETFISGTKPVAFSSNGERALSPSDNNTIKVWNLTTGEISLTLPGHNKPISAVVFTSNGERAISASKDKTIKVWSLTTGQELFTFDSSYWHATTITVTPDDKLVDNRTLKVWDLTSGKKLFTLPGHTREINTVAVTPDGQRLISGSSDRTLKVWDLTSGKEIFTLPGHMDWVSRVAVTPDGQRLISASSDLQLKVWDLKTGDQLFTFQSHSSEIDKVSKFESGDSINFITGERQFTIKKITGLAVTPCGQRVISTSNNGILKVWDFTTQEEVAMFVGESSMSCCAVNSDGRTIIGAEASGVLHFLRLEGIRS